MPSTKSTRGDQPDGPSISVVIVSYNSRADLEQCLPSLYAQDALAEIIVVDNGSTDGTVDWLRQAHPDVHVLALAQNGGYAAANNRGIEAARGCYVLVLNPDTVVQMGALRKLVDQAEAHPRAFINPKLVQPDGTLNTCGNDMHYTGITTCTGLGENPDGYTGIRRPFLLSGAAILARRDAWLDLGGFDERFFLYMEDTDLSLRVRLKRYEILCVADAIITHHYKLAMNSRKFYYLERNRLLTLLKTYESRTLLRLLPGLALTEVATWAFATARGPRYLAARWRGYAWLWRHRSEWAKWRSVIQTTRQVPDSILVSRMQVRLPCRQMISRPALAHLAEWLTTPLYRRLRPC